MAARLYDSRIWRRLKNLYLLANPWCVICTARGRQNLAAVVDHIIPHRGDEKLFWDEENWQGLCRNCHSSAKQAMEKSGRDYIVDAGVDGNPIDPRHPWNTGGG